MTDKSVSLSEHINLHIKANGPMSLSTYMSLALTHPTQGYYRKADPLGTHGDFITAPEISQMFGEMLGIWIVQTRQQLGAPKNFNIVELGPGRGTLMSDALRILAQVPEIQNCFDVRLIETNPALIEKQKLALKDAPVFWHSEIEELSALEGPFLILANEFFDALPVKQFQKAKGKWHERMVGLYKEQRVWGLSPSPLPEDAFPASIRDAEDNAIWESSFASQQVANEIGELLNAKGGAMLAIDYGYGKTQTGETLQALKSHKHVDALAEPGDADITAHVDFEALTKATKTSVGKLMTQGDFLRALGIQQRAHALASATPAAAQKIATDLARLIDTEQMGDLFKVSCCYAGNVAPYPFEAEDG